VPRAHRDELLAARRRLLRQAEFFLGAADPRRLVTFTKMERASHSFLAHLSPPGEVLEIPYEGASLYAYFVSAGTSTERQPCLISMGGLDFDQGRDVVHAGARRAAERHLRAHDRRPGNRAGHSAATGS